MPVYINKGFSTLPLTLGYNRGPWLVNPGEKIKISEDELKFLKETKQFDKRVLQEFKPGIKAKEVEEPKSTEPVPTDEKTLEEPTAPEGEGEKPQEEPDKVELPPFTSTKAALIEFATAHEIQVTEEQTKSEIYNTIKENLK